MLGSDSAKRKRSDGSKLASVEMREQTGSYMSPQSVRASSPSKDQGRSVVHPSKKPRRNASPDLDAEMSNAAAEPPAWTHTYAPPPSNINPVGSPELMTPTRSPDAGNEMDLDISTKEQESDPPPHQSQNPPPSQPQPQQHVLPPPQQIHQQQADSPPRPQATFTLPTGSGSHTWTEEDRTLIEQLRLQMSKQPGYNEFLESRNKQPTMREQLTQYTYVARQLEEHTGRGSNVKKVCIGFSVACESCSLCLVIDACDGCFQFTGIVGGCGAGGSPTLRALRSRRIRVRGPQNHGYAGRSSPCDKQDTGGKILGPPPSASS